MEGFGEGWGGGLSAVTLSLICLRGVQDNIISDWGLWPPPRLEGKKKKKTLQRERLYIPALPSEFRVRFECFQLLNSFGLANRNIQNALSIAGVRRWVLKVSSENDKFREASLSTQQRPGTTERVRGGETPWSQRTRRHATHTHTHTGSQTVEAAVA